MRTALFSFDWKALWHIGFWHVQMVHVSTDCTWVSLDALLKSDVLWYCVVQQTTRRHHARKWRASRKQLRDRVASPSTSSRTSSQCRSRQNSTTLSATSTTWRLIVDTLRAHLLPRHRQLRGTHFTPVSRLTTTGGRRALPTSASHWILIQTTSHQSHPRRRRLWTISVDFRHHHYRRKMMRARWWLSHRCVHCWVASPPLQNRSHRRHCGLETATTMALLVGSR